MMENIVQYRKLKTEIIRIAGESFDFQKVKDYFSEIVDSTRTLSRIKNLNQLFHVLEERDALDSNYVSLLFALGSFLGIEDIKVKVSSYKKLYVEDENGICSCGEIRAFITPINFIQREHSVESNDNLETAMDTIAKNIGKNWPVLARELKIQECYIDEIREKYPVEKPSDMCQQALKALQIWKKYNQDAATIDVLKHALDARLCKMEGIGAHMMTPMVTVD